MAHAQLDNSQLRSITIQLRAKESQRSLIDKAAHALGKNRSDFLLETACREAESILLDQRLFSLSDENYKNFIAALDAPPSMNEKLRDLLLRKAPWDE